MMITTQKLDQTANIPKRHSKEAAGCDIHTNESGIINPKESGEIRTGIKLKVPEGYVALVYGRSGISNKYLLEVFNTCICPENEKELVVNFFNHGKIPFEYKKGERIAQLVFVKIEENIKIEI